MEHADSRLETSAESIDDFVRRPHRPIHLTRGSYTEKFTVSLEFGSGDVQSVLHQTS